MGGLNCCGKPKKESADLEVESQKQNPELGVENTTASRENLGLGVRNTIVSSENLRMGAGNKVVGYSITGFEVGNKVRGDGNSSIKPAREQLLTKRPSNSLQNDNEVVMEDVFLVSGPNPGDIQNVLSKQISNASRQSTTDITSIRASLVASEHDQVNIMHKKIGFNGISRRTSSTQVYCPFADEERYIKYSERYIPRPWENDPILNPLNCRRNPPIDSIQCDRTYGYKNNCRIIDRFGCESATLPLRYWEDRYHFPPENY